MEQINDLASVLGIISAAVSLTTALRIKSYYNKITNFCSAEKLAVAEQKAIDAKRIYQELKEMYLEKRGRNPSTYSKKYMEIDNTLDEIIHSLPSVYSEISELIKNVKELINDASQTEIIMDKDKQFLELGTLLDTVYESIVLQRNNVKSEVLLKS